MPHLVFDRLTSAVGERVRAHGLSFRSVVLLVVFVWWVADVVWQVATILKALFPVPRPDSHRVITFANQEDFISFRFVFVTLLCLCFVFLSSA
jgi:U3 small nucleolar ribonucleoprotein protein IMP4